MGALAICLVLFSAFFHAVRSLFTKSSGDKQVFLWLYSIFALLFFAPLCAYFIFRVGITDPSAYAWCVGSGFIHFMYWIFLTNAYKEGDLSHVYPIMRSSPALVLVFAVLFLGEQVSVEGVIGILLVAVGVYIINMKHISRDEFLEPFKSVASDRSTRFAFLTLVSVALYSIADKLAVDYIHPIIFAFLHLFCGMCFYTPFVLLTKKIDDIRNEWNNHWVQAVLAGVIGIIGYSLILIAFTIERVSYIVGLRQLSVVFAVFMGSLVLKEKHTGIRLSGAVIIFAGCFLISMAR
jgi:uncharacterized membrane protein